MYYRAAGFGSIWDDIGDAVVDTIPKVVGGDPEPNPKVVQFQPEQQNTVGAFLSGSAVTCTGTVIAPRVVLSAAHCSVVGRGTRFVLGPDAALPIASATVLAVARHPGFRAGSSGSDYLLAYLDRDLPVLPLGVGGPPSVGEVVQTVGYGRTAAATSGNTTRLWLSEQVREVGPDTFAVFSSGQHGMCMGDSGGPVLRMEADQPVVVGILSWGDRDCTGTDVFQRPDVVQDWIRATIENWKTSPPTPQRAGLGWVLGLLLAGMGVGLIVAGRKVT